MKSKLNQALANYCEYANSFCTLNFSKPKALVALTTLALNTIPADVDAGIIYTDPVPDLNLHPFPLLTAYSTVGYASSHVTQRIDINNDSIDDFEFHASIRGTQFGTPAFAYVLPLNQNAIAVVGGGGQANIIPSTYPFGATIDQNSDWRTGLSIFISNSPVPGVIHWMGPKVECPPDLLPK